LVEALLFSASDNARVVPSDVEGPEFDGVLAEAETRFRAAATCEVQRTPPQRPFVRNEGGTQGRGRGR
jgi:hypothetical protein